MMAHAVKPPCRATPPAGRRDTAIEAQAGRHHTSRSVVPACRFPNARHFIGAACWLSNSRTAWFSVDVFGRVVRAATATVLVGRNGSDIREDEMYNDSDVTRRTFLGVAAAAALVTASSRKVAADAPSALAQGGPVAPPEVAPAGRPQGTDKFGASVDTVPVIDAHIHLF